MSIRLLYLTHEGFPTYHADIAILFGKYLPQLGIYADIVTERMSEDDKTKSTLPWQGGKAILCHTPKNRGWYHIIKFLHNLKTLLTCDANTYQAIQVRDLPVAGLCALLIARYKKIPFFYWMSYPQSEGQIHRAKSRGWRAGIRYFFPLLQGYFGKFLLYRIVMRYSDYNFVQSEKMRSDVMALGLPKSKMTPVPMAVDLDTAKIADIIPSNDTRLHGKRVIIYMGTLDRTRNIEVLFQMLVLVRDKLPNLLLVMVGSTDDTGHEIWLKQEAKRLGVNDLILWTGWLEMSEAWRYARAAEVGLSPIPRGFLLDMGIPTKALEYMALNIPVLCNDNPYQQQAVTESGAGLCVSLTAENFAEALLTILENDTARQQMANAGRAYIEQHWNYQTVTQDLAAMYRQLLGTQHD